MDVFKKYLSNISKIDKELRVLLFLYFLQALATGSVFFIGIYLSHKSLDVVTISHDITFLIIGNLVGAYISSKLTDKINPSYLSSIGLIIQGICLVLIPNISEQLIFSFTIFLLGMGIYTCNVANNFMITSLSGKDEESRSTAISFLSIASNLGIGLGGSIIGYVTQSGSSAAFYVFASLTILMSFYYFINPVEVKKIIENNQKDESIPSSKRYYLSLFSIMIIGFIFAQMRVGYSIFLDTHFDAKQISTIIGLNSFLIIILMSSVRAVSIKNNPVLMMGLGGLLLGGGMSFLSFFKSYYSVLIICCIWTLGEMLGTLFSQLICFESAPKNKRGSAMGNYKLNYSLGTIFGTIAGGEILHLKGLVALWELCGLMGSLILIMSILLLIVEKKRAAYLLKGVG